MLFCGCIEPLNLILLPDVETTETLGHKMTQTQDDNAHYLCRIVEYWYSGTRL